MNHARQEFGLHAADLHDYPDLDEAPERVLDFALSAVGADGAALMLTQPGGKIETVAATSADIQAVDELQLKLSEGPCLSALLSEPSVVVDDTALDPRWPTWGRATAETGYHSMLCVQLRDPAGMAGALNLYGREVAAFDEDDIAVAHVLARHVSIALHNARQMSQLHTAIDARKLIGQAQGILMERYSIDADQAFAVLRRYSQHNNIKLRVIAERLIESRKLPGDS
jgi:GAF domain-containing protein